MLLTPLATLPSIAFSVYCNVLCCAVVIRSIARCTLPFSRSLRTMKNSPNFSMFVTRSMFTCFTLLYITKLLQCDTATDTE